MKRAIIWVALLTVALPVFSQTDWKKIDALLEEDMVKTAYSQAEAIFKKTKNSTDLLTAAWYMKKAAAEYQEDVEDSARARYRSILPRLDAVDRAVCYAFLHEKDSALLDRELLKKTPSDRIRRFCYNDDGETKGVNLTPTAFDVVIRSLDGDRLDMLQQLIDFHKDDDDFLRISLDMEMIEWMEYQYDRDGVDTIFQRYINKYRGSDCPLLAQLYYKMASNLSNIDRNEEALRYCDTAIALFPKSHGGTMCANLRSIICRARIYFPGSDAGSTAYPGRPSLHRLGYENVSRLYFSIYNYNGTDISDFAKNLPQPLHQWHLDTKDDGSHKEKNLIFDLPALASGNYLLMASVDEKFDAEDAYITLACIDFDLCQMADDEYLMVDAVTGAPIEGQDVVLYDNLKRPLDTAVTYPDGRFRIPGGRDFRMMRITRGGGSIERNIWSYSRSRFEKLPEPKAHIMVDRPVYRPGDTIHYAALFYESDGLDGQVLANRTATLSFRDPNGKVKSEVNLVTDDYGVVSTTFVLPSDALPGHWSVILRSGEVTRYQYVNVEVYKQPKFMVSLDKGNGERPAFGQPYTLRGLAQAYSGAMISGAKVKYTVSRVVYWNYRWGITHSRNSFMSFSDSTVTAADGSFEITFTPMPDSAVDLSRKPGFVYSIEVEVTDLTGETHGANTRFYVTYINEKVEVSTRRSSLQYSYLDLNSNPLKGEVQLKVERLRAPDNPRLTPSIISTNSGAEMSLTPDEFRRLFPNYTYSSSENEPSQKEVEWSYEINHYADGSQLRYTVELPMEKFSSGVYRVVAIAGEATDTQYVTYVTPREKKLPTADLLWTDGPDEVEVGETFTFRYASAFEGTRVFCLLTAPDGQEISSEWLTAGRRIKSLSIPVDSSLLGGFQVHLNAVREGVHASKDITVDVPFSHKKLNVDITTFRDKLQPGEEEEWTIKVEGSGDSHLSPLAPQGRRPQFTSHLIMSMFDASLTGYGHTGIREFNPWRRVYHRSTNWVSFNSLHYSHYYQKSEELDYPDPASYRLVLSDDFDEDMVFHELSFGSSVLNEVSIEADRVPIIEVGTPESGTKIKSSTARGEDCMVTMQGGVRKRTGVNVVAEEKEEIFTVVEKEAAPEIKIRTNLNTLAFFVSDLHTDSSGTATFRFRVPELLTRWQIQGLAFTNNLKTGSLNRTLVTQKPLMVQPNIPRFIRHGDSIVLMAKVVNLTDSARQVLVSFSLKESTSNSVVGDLVADTLTVPAQGSAQVTFPVSNLPRDLYVATYEIVARTCDEKLHPSYPQLGDGERGQIPVVSDRQAVTLSQPLYINGKGKKTFTFHLSPFTSTATPHFLGAELVSNPIWLAVKSMPYLQQTENPSSLYLANRLYVNTLGQQILKDLSGIKGLKGLKAFSALNDTANTPLKISDDVKQTLLEATPWLRDAEAEVEQRRAIANYFDSTRMAEELEKLQAQLAARQNSDGGWGWMPESESSLWVTEQVLKRINVSSYQPDNKEKALAYIDREEQLHYEKFIKPYLKKGYKWAPDNIDYLYTRSFYGKGKTEAYKFYYSNALKNYKSYDNLYTQAQLALIFQRHGDKKTARNVIRRLKEKSLESDEMGIYWRDNRSGWFWYERPIETQALLIQAFTEVTPQDTATIALMQQWLLKQKQTNHWGNDQATVAAINALMIQNTPKTPNNQHDQITMKVCDAELSAPSEGLEEYRTQRWAGPALDSIISLGDSTIVLRKETPGIAWGAVYFQYTDDMDKIPSSESGITLKRSYQVVSGQLPVASEATALTTDHWPLTTFHVGDRIKVRIEISCDRTMEYLELIDGRPSCVEPVSTKSGWQWSHGLRYYVAVKNTATHCYINRLEKGKYIVEYDVFVTNPGTFMAGPVTMQCMYAPEFRATAPGQQIVIR